MPNYRYRAPEYGRPGGCYGQSSMAPRQRQGFQASCGNAGGNVSQAASCGNAGRNVNQAASCGNAGGNACQTVSCGNAGGNTGQMSCAVSEKYDVLSGAPVAMAYVPWQMWSDILDTEKGFCCGTIFGELNKPFRGMGGVC